MPFPASDDFKRQKNLLEQEDPYKYLIEFEYSDGNWIRLTDHVQNVVWNGLTWLAYPITVSDVEYSADGESQTLSVSVSNAGRTLSEYLFLYNGLIGRNGNIYLVNLAWLNDPTYSVIPEYFVVVASGGMDIVIFKLSLSLDAYVVEGPMESFDHDKFPGMPVVSPRISIGIM